MAGQLWCPGARKHDGSWGSSNPYVGKGAKVVWHTTESDPGTIPGNLAWATSQGYGPHLWWDPVSGELVQSLPASVPATAVADPNGRGWNRAGTVVLQVEVIGRASKAPMAQPMKGREQVMEWLRGWGIPDRWPAGVPERVASGDRTVYGLNSPAGHYAHAQMPDNSHVDPGRVDADLLFQGEDMALNADDKEFIRKAIEQEVWGHRVQLDGKDTRSFAATVNLWDKRTVARIAGASALATVKALQGAGTVPPTVDADVIAEAVADELAARLAE